MKTVTSADGTTIAYEQSGNGPAAILVGGAMNDRHSAAELADMLASTMTAVTYDRRGRGDSGDTKPYAVKREVEDLGALINEFGDASVYGVSSGANLAFEAAAAGYPVRKLAMVEPMYRLSDAPPLAPDYQEHIIELTDAGDMDEVVKYFMTEGMKLPPQAFQGLQHSPMWPGIKAIAHTIMYDVIIMGDGALPADRMAKVTVPALVVNSKASSPWMHHTVEEAAKALSHGEHRVLDGDFHHVPPPVLGPVLAEFFA